MSDQQSKALLLRIQRQNARVAEAAGAKFIAGLRKAGAGDAAPAGPDMAAGTQLSSLEGSPFAAQIIEGYRRLGPVVGLSVLANEPRLVQDELVWLRRALGARNAAPVQTDWERHLLEAYSSACGEILGEGDCTVIRTILERATASPAR